MQSSMLVDDGQDAMRQDCATLDEMELVVVRLGLQRCFEGQVGVGC